ncbi:MAG: YicC/YloC family endoribonuclease [Myxococcota bacterium]
MTGFGVAHRHRDARLLSVEARSVNHRFCDVRFSLPRDQENLVSQLEPVVRRAIRRGRVDVSVSVTFSADAVVEPSVDVGRARGYWQAYQQLAEAVGQPAQIPLSILAQSPGVFVAPDAKLDVSEDLPLIREALDEALAGLLEMRKAEGQQIRQMLGDHLKEVERLRGEVVARMPQVLVERQGKLRKRLEELLDDRSLDEQRLAQEIAVLADRVDVTEETERLQSHLQQFSVLLSNEGAVGRKMDFLIQEMNREANTIGSKCSDAAAAHIVVDLKAELERMREQIQNVE